MNYKHMPPRYGFDVCVSQTGHICIKQKQYIQGPYPEDVTTILHPEEARFLIRALRQTCRDAQGCPQPVEPLGLEDQPTDNRRPSQ